jgi:hypothetical protein
MGRAGLTRVVGKKHVLLKVVGVVDCVVVEVVVVVVGGVVVVVVVLLLFFLYYYLLLQPAGPGLVYDTTFWAHKDFTI